MLYKCCKHIVKSSKTCCKNIEAFLTSFQESTTFF